MKRGDDVRVGCCIGEENMLEEKAQDVKTTVTAGDEGAYSRTASRTTTKLLEDKAIDRQIWEAEEKLRHYATWT